MNSEPDLIATALKMFYSLAITLGILIIAFYVVRRILKKEAVGAKSKLIRVLANTCVGVKKSVSLVQVPGSLLVLGITRDRISLLVKIDEHKIQDEDMSYDKVGIFSSFSDEIRRFAPKTGRSKRGK